MKIKEEYKGKTIINTDSKEIWDYVNKFGKFLFFILFAIAFKN